MNKLIVAILCLIYQASVICNPTIAILIGSGSTGKTSIASAISKISSDWYIIEEDQLCYKLEREAIYDKFPEEFEIIIKAINPCNVLSAIQNDILLFDESADEETINAAKLALQTITSFKRRYRFITQEDVFQEIDKGLKQGKNVLIDDWFLNVENVKINFPDIKVLQVFVYSSLFSCHKRFKQRNKKPISNLDAARRMYGQLICYYVDLYKLTNQSDHPFPEFNKQQIKRWFEKTSKKVRSNEDDVSLGDKAHAVYATEITREILNACRDKLITYDIEEEPVFFEPRMHYDILLNYENLTPEMATFLLLQNIEEFK